jgi:hypothetical protein
LGYILEAKSNVYVKNVASMFPTKFPPRK